MIFRNESFLTFASSVFRESKSGCSTVRTILLSVGITEYIHMSVLMKGYEGPGNLEGNKVQSFLDAFGAVFFWIITSISESELLEPGAKD